MKCKNLYVFAVARAILIATILSVLPCAPELYAAHTEVTQYMVRNYTEDNDWMPSSVVTSILKDNEGNIWVATRRGVVCYTGYFESQIAKTDKSGQIYYLDCDSRGRVWGTSIGDSLEIKQMNGSEAIIPKIDISIPDNMNNIWASGSVFSVCSYNKEITVAVGVIGHGIYVYRRHQWKFFGKSNDFNPANMTNVLAEGRNIYVCSKDGLYYVDDRGNRKIKNTPVLALRRSTIHKDQMWFLTSNTFGYYDSHKKTHYYDRKLPVAMAQFYNKYLIVPDFYGKLVYSDKNGVFVCDLNNNNVDTLNMKDGLVGNVATSMCLDNGNNLWVASFGGLSKIAISSFSNYNINSGLLENMITSIVERKPNNILLLHGTGFSVFDGKNIIGTGKYNVAKPDRVANAVKDPAGNVWCANYLNGIIKISPNNAVKILKPDQLGVQQIVCIALDSNKNLLVSDGTGIYELHNENLRKINNMRLPLAIRRNIRHMFISPRNEIYVATKNAGVCLFRNRKFIKQFLPRDENNGGARNIYSICFDESGGGLFVGTEDGLYHTYNDRLHKYDTKQLQLQKFIFFITKDKEENLWLGTDNGIARLAADGTITSYTSRNGLIGGETYTDAGKIISESRDLYIGFERGLSVLCSITKEDRTPIPNIANIIYSENGNKKRKLFENQKIKLSGDNFEIMCNVPDFTREEYNIIRYRLNGYDENWQTIHTFYKNTVTYRNLPDGKYYLNMYAVNATGESGQLFQSGEIIVNNKPSFLGLTLAHILIITVLILLLTYLWRRYLKKHKINNAIDYERLFHDNMEYFDNMNVNMLLISINDLTVRNINKAFVTFTGISKRSIIGKKITGIVKVVKQNLHDMEQEEFVNYFLRMSREVTFTMPVINIEYSFMIYSSKFNKQDHQDHNDLLVWILFDISNEKTYKAKLAKTESETNIKINQKTHELANSLEAFRHAMSVQESVSKSLKSAQKELKRLYEYERQENTFKTNFIKTISHVYRTPLTVITSSAEIIEAGIEKNKPEYILPAVTKINNSVVTLTELFDALANTGHTTCESARFNLNYVLNAIMQRVAEIFGNDHQVTFRPCNEQTNIYQDSSLIAQAFFQILSNAYKHTPAGTEILVEVKSDGREIVLSVTDKGNGVTPEHLAKIFNESVDTAVITSEQPGLGLGLAIAKHNTELIGGQIFAASEYGKWFKMTMQFPEENI